MALPDTPGPLVQGDEAEQFRARMECAAAGGEFPLPIEKG